MAPPGQYRVSPGVYRPIPKNGVPQAMQQGVQNMGPSTQGMSMGPHAVSQLQAASGQPMPRMSQMPHYNPAQQAGQMAAQFNGQMPRQGTGWNQPGVGSQGNNPVNNNFGFGEPMAGAVRPQYNSNSQPSFGFGGPNGQPFMPEYINDAQGMPQTMNPQQDAMNAAQQSFGQPNMQGMQPARPQNGPQGRPAMPSRPQNGPQGRPSVAPGLMGKPPVNNHSTATQKRIPNAVKLAAQGRY